jgi:hypothetical protein
MAKAANKPSKIVKLFAGRDTSRVLQKERKHPQSNKVSLARSVIVPGSGIQMLKLKMISGAAVLTHDIIVC